MALTDITTPHVARIRARLDRAMAVLGQRYTDYAAYRSRHDKIAALDAKTDAELAAMGLTRAAIVRHVFRDRLYI